MALINCPKCGKQISDQGPICPHCMTSMAELRALSGTSAGQGVVFCRKCGAKMRVHDKFCPSCGASVSGVSSPQQPPKKKKSGCFFTILKIFVVIIFLSLLAVACDTAMDKEPKSSADADEADNAATEEDSEELTSEEWLEFDSRSWEDFTVLYKNHQNLVDAINAYSSGHGSDVSFYDYCKQMEVYFRDASLQFRYGENKEQRDYLWVLESLALSDQQVTKHLMKYLDSGKVSDSSKAQECLNDAEKAISVYANNRGLLLANTDLSDSEIEQKLSDDLAALEALLE